MCKRQTSTRHFYEDGDGETVLKQMESAAPYGLTGAIIAQDRHAVAAASEDLGDDQVTLGDYVAQRWALAPPRSGRSVLGKEGRPPCGVMLDVYNLNSWLHQAKRRS